MTYGTYESHALTNSNRELFCAADSATIVREFHCIQSWPAARAKYKIAINSRQNPPEQNNKRWNE